MEPRLAVVLGIILACGMSVYLPARASAGDDQLPPKARCAELNVERQCALWFPSLIELIARPELYDGRRVRVIGFVNFEFEGDAIFLSSEDWKHSVVTNSLWVEAPPGFQSDSGPARKQPNRRYVIIEGTFNARKRGHLGLGSGAIEHVTRI